MSNAPRDVPPTSEARWLCGRCEGATDLEHHWRCPKSAITPIRALLRIRDEVDGVLRPEPGQPERSMNSASSESADDPMWKGGRRYENEECARVAEQYQRDVEASIQPRLTGQSLEGYNSIANFERGRVQAARDLAAHIRRRPIAAGLNSGVAGHGEIVLPFKPTDDPHITCISCFATGCAFEIAAGKPGRRSEVGLCAACRAYFVTRGATPDGSVDTCPLCNGSGHVEPTNGPPDPPSDDGGWNDATRANYERMFPWRHVRQARGEFTVERATSPNTSDVAAEVYQVDGLIDAPTLAYEIAQMLNRRERDIASARR